jgi:hypothetical protein
VPNRSHKQAVKLIERETDSGDSWGLGS